MRLIRVWFTKTGSAKYMSHLDLNRCMIRAVRRAKIPIWYTEGFNSHPFLTFALPLSLGIEGTRETMDMKLLEGMELEEVRERLNRVLPREIRVLDVREALMKPKVIAFAQYELELTAPGLSAEELKESVETVLARPEIIVPRRTKSGIRDFNLAPSLTDYHCEITERGACRLSIVLPAGSTQNVNPIVVVDALSLGLQREVVADVRRMDIYDEHRASFC